MKKNRNKMPAVYKSSCVLLTVFCLLASGAEYRNLTTGTAIREKNLYAVEMLSDIRSEIGMAERSGTSWDAVETAFSNAEKMAGAYLEDTGLTELKKQRMMQCSQYITAYHALLLSENGEGTEGEGNAAQIQMVRTGIHEMLDACIEAESGDAEQALRQSELLFYGMLGALLLLFVFGFQRILRSGIQAKHMAREMWEKENALRDMTDRLESSELKTKEMAMWNILTNTPNRYALEEWLGANMEKEQFDIAFFDVDNFRHVNGMHGYEIGDRYLAAIAKTVKETYHDKAEVYSINGNTFALVFHEEIPSMQVKLIAEQVRQTMANPVTIGDIIVSKTVSGSLYHSLPVDCLTIRELFQKLEEAISTVKNDGGGRLYYVDSH